MSPLKSRLMNYMTPFPFIQELKDVEDLKGFNDVLQVLSMVYTTVPWFMEPYTEEVKYSDIESLYRKFNKREIGGWCGLNAEFFKWIIEGYRRKDLTIKYRSYNYGLSGILPKVEKRPFYKGGFTHIGVLVEIDRMEYYYDPYFARYFIHADGYPLQFKDLMYFISERKFDRYESVFLPLEKPVVRESGTVDFLTPQQFMKEVLDFFYEQDFLHSLKDVFGTENPDSLMLIKIPV